MEMRNMFKSVFGKNNKNNTNPYSLPNFELINGYTSYLTKSSGDLQNDLTVKTCIDTIAKHAAKLKPCHIRQETTSQSVINDRLNQLLTNRPNPYQSTYDFLYKITSSLLLEGNCFIYIKRNNLGNIEGYYILDFSSVELKEKDGLLFCLFNFAGNPTVVNYDNIIHLRRNYDSGDFFGSKPYDSLKDSLDNLQVARQSIGNKIRNSGAITGILKLAGSTAVNNWYEKALEFANKFKSFKAQTGGIAAIDSTAEFQNVPININTAEESQLKFLNKEIIGFFGLNESIIQGNYNESQYQAFYESIIEPLAIQLSQEFTEKTFTAKEKGHGNIINFNSNRLSYASTENKVNMIRELGALGIISINEARSLFELEPVADGAKRLVSLNFVNADKADKYQLKEDNKPQKTLKGGE